MLLLTKGNSLVTWKMTSSFLSYSDLFRISKDSSIAEYETDITPGTLSCFLDLHFIGIYNFHDYGPYHYEC